MKWPTSANPPGKQLFLSMQKTKLELLVARKWIEAQGTTGIELVSLDDQPLPAFSPGSHVILHLPNGVSRQYSLCNDPTETHRYKLAVLRTRDSRGGSSYVADQLKVGDILAVDGPRSNFPLETGAEKTILIAGGIGITPLLSMVYELERGNRPYKLYYCARSRENAALLEELSGPGIEDRVELVFDQGDPAQGLDVNALIGTVDDSTVVYCCGPESIMAAVKNAGAKLRSGQLRFESFGPAPTSAPADTVQDNEAFEVSLAKSGRVVTVPSGKSILSVLREHGYAADSLCEEGYCGTCVVPLLEGKADHRDTVLTDAERDENKAIAICCSRAKSRRLKLDL